MRRLNRVPVGMGILAATLACAFALFGLSACGGSGASGDGGAATASAWQPGEDLVGEWKFAGQFLGTAYDGDTFLGSMYIVSGFDLCDIYGMDADDPSKLTATSLAEVAALYDPIVINEDCSGSFGSGDTLQEVTWLEPGDDENVLECEGEADSNAVHSISMWTIGGQVVIYVNHPIEEEDGSEGEVTLVYTKSGVIDMMPPVSMDGAAAPASLDDISGTWDAYGVIRQGRVVVCATAPEAVPNGGVLQSMEVDADNGVVRAYGSSTMEVEPRIENGVFTLGDDQIELKASPDGSTLFFIVHLDDGSDFVTLLKRSE